MLASLTVGRGVVPTAWFRPGWCGQSPACLSTCHVPAPWSLCVFPVGIQKPGFQAEETGAQGLPSHLQVPTLRGTNDSYLPSNLGWGSQGGGWRGVGANLPVGTDHSLVKRPTEIQAVCTEEPGQGGVREAAVEG